MGIFEASTAEKPTRAISPFRYPGGKAWLTDFLAAELNALAPNGGIYLEPYAGGAGAAIKLLASGAAEEIYLNDRDPRVYCAWRSILRENEHFQDKLATVPTTIEQWWTYKRMVDNPALAADWFELGFATYFLNRTNRSGIVQGAAPIGGYHQEREWRLDARFYRETMLSRIKWLGKNAGRIHLSRLDGLIFLRRMAKKTDVGRALFFIDPPYVAAGSRLYLNAMAEQHHRALAQYLCAGEIPNWVVTYDDCNLIRGLYASEQLDELDVRYTLQKKRIEREVVIRPRGKSQH